MSYRTFSIVCLSGLLIAAGSASASIVYNTQVTPTKANGHFIAGSGIPSNVLPWTPMLQAYRSL